MNIELQPEEYTKILEFMIGDYQYATVLVNLDVTTAIPDRFIIVKELSRFDDGLEDKIIERAKNIAISKLWIH